MSTPLVRKLEHGAALSEEDRRFLDRAVTDKRRFGAGADIIAEGAAPEFVHVVMEGYACRYKTVEDGGRQIMAWLVPGDFCDLHVALLGEMDHSIAALSACRIGLMSRRIIAEITDTRPQISRAMWWATLVDEGILREWLVGMGRRPADTRIAHLFCELQARLAAVGLDDGGAMDLPVNQVELADTVGLTPVHVNRVIQRLREEGLIQLDGRRLTLLDLKALQAFAGFDPNYLHLDANSKAGGGLADVRVGRSDIITP